MSFFNFLKKVGQIAGQAAPDLIAMVSPPMGALIGTVINSIFVAEAKNGPGHGDLKKMDAMACLETCIPLLTGLVKNTTGKELADEAQLAAGLDKLVDALVAVMNAFRILPKKA
jgi:hypothetical protein